MHGTILPGVIVAGVEILVAAELGVINSQSAFGLRHITETSTPM